MIFQVLLPGLFNGLFSVFDINSHFLFSQMIDNVVNVAALLLQLRCEVGIPSETGVNKKTVKYHHILQDRPFKITAYKYSIQT